MRDEAEMSEVGVESDQGGQNRDGGDHQKRPAERCGRHSERDRGGNGGSGENEEDEIEE